MLKPQNSLELLKAVKNDNLLIKLIEQLNKDFQLSGIFKVFDINASFDKLNEELAEILINLIQFKYDDYLNLIYRVDISEKELATIKNNNLVAVGNQIAFLILKREFQKVWLKQNYN
jgi:hypothetical protein